MIEQGGGISRRFAPILESIREEVCNGLCSDCWEAGFQSPNDQFSHMTWSVIMWMHNLLKDFETCMCLWKNLTALMQIQLIPTYSQSASLFDACLLFPRLFPLFTDQNYLIQDTSLYEWRSTQTLWKMSGFIICDDYLEKQYDFSLCYAVADLQVRGPGRYCLTLVFAAKNLKLSDFEDRQV